MSVQHPDYDPVTVVFDNKDAIPRVTLLYVHRPHVPDVALWYGSFYAGDSYTLEVDGEIVPLGPNGEIEASA